MKNLKTSLLSFCLLACFLSRGSEADFRRQIQASTYQRGFFLTTNAPSARHYLGITNGWDGASVPYVINFANSASMQLLNSSNETSIIPSGLGTTGTNIVDANLLTNYAMIRLSARGYLKCITNTTLRIKLKLNSSTIADSGAIDMQANSALRGFGYDSTITFQPGNTPTNSLAIATGQAFYFLSGTNRITIDVPDTGNVGTLINATAALTEDVTAQWSIPDSNNQLSIHSIVSEVILP